MVPIAPVVLAVVITMLWSKEMWGQDSSKTKEEGKKMGKKLVLYLEDEDGGAKEK